MKNSIINFLIFCLVSGSINAQTANDNRVKVFTARTPLVGDISLVSDKSRVTEVVNYYDGLGREKQSVSRAASPLGNDVVKFTVYDDYGKNVTSYLPYVSSEKNGSMRSGPISEQVLFYKELYEDADATSAFSQQLLEHSELARPLIQSSPGAAWSMSTGKVVRKQHATNITGEVNYYQPGKLARTTTIDEDGLEAREYLDDEGRIVCKKIKAASGVYASTDYFYDDFGNLQVVIQPEGDTRLPQGDRTTNGADLIPSSILDNWAFQYRYDGRRRTTHKKIPGADWVFMVYDDRNRPVMTQDGEQRRRNQWTFTRYDALNRPIVTGLYTHDIALDQVGMTALIDTTYFYETFNGSSDFFGYTNRVMPSSRFKGSFEPLTITYYDDNAFINHDLYFDYKWTPLEGQYEYTKHGHDPFPRVIGQVTGTWTRVLGKDRQWLRVVNYYDDKHRLIQVIGDNHKRGQDILTNVYDFTGKVIASRTESTDHHVDWGNAHPSAWTTADRVKNIASSAAVTPFIFSSQQLGANSDGWIEFTCSSDLTASTSRTFGFSISTTSLNVGYGVRQDIVGGTSMLRIYENNVAKGTPVSAQGGDVIRIERNGMTMRYSKNGVTFYTTVLTSRPALYPHALLGQPGAELFNPCFSIPGSRKSIERHFEYDHTGRLLKTWHSIDEADSILLVKNEYNELGQLIDKKLHSADNENFHQSIDYRYNIRGWITSINGAQLAADIRKNPETQHDRSDLFGMDLLYDDANSGIGNRSLFNGNISAIRWSAGLALGNTKERAYQFRYDSMNRLMAATQKVRGSVWSSSSAFQESGLTYDLNGNIKTLTRTDETGAQMDILTYDYGAGNATGNVLRKVSDAGTTAGFADGVNASDDYAYNANGSLTIDRNKNIIAISYSHLNLPDKITKSNGEYLTYTYDATGRKLAQSVYTPANVLKKRSDYCGEWFYENDTLRFLNHEEGRALPDGDWVNAPQLLPGTDMSTTSNFSPYGTSKITMTSVTLNGQNYLRTVSNQSSGTPGFVSLFVDVIPGRMYTLKVKGYRTSSAPVVLYVQGTGSVSSDIVWPGPLIPNGSGAEGWVEVTFTVPPAIKLIRVGCIWNGAQLGATFYINKMELYEYNGDHGNTVFSQTGYEYQYHLKDHLGNVRMTFTTKDEVESLKATVEAETESEDRSNFLRYDLARRVKSSLFDHTKGDATGYAIRLNGSANEKIGLAKSLSVMPGDTIRAKVFAKYVDPNNDNWKSALATLMGYLASPATAPVNTIVDGAGYSVSGTTSLGLTPINHSNEVNGAVPKAYLNYIFINKNFELSSVDSWYVRITNKGLENGSDVAHDSLTFERVVKEAGYVYVYLSNDGEEVREVYFDDLEVLHVKGPIVQLQDYYPFGLTFNTFQRENALYNRLQYNGKEIQDALSLRWFDYGARMYMPDIGRWSVIDPISETSRRWSPFNYGLDNPSRFIDPDGMQAKDIFYINNNGNTERVEQAGNHQFYVQTSTGETGSHQDEYQLVATLAENDDGLVQFPGSGAGYGRYGQEDAGGISRNPAETVGQGDHFVTPETAASLFGVLHTLNNSGSVNNIKLGDMSSSNGSDPWQSGSNHHLGHGHNGNRSGLDVDFRYINDQGNSFQSADAFGSAEFSANNNQSVFDAANHYGFSVNYQGTNGTLNGPANADGHNDHGHVGRQSNNSNITTIPSAKPNLIGPQLPPVGLPWRRQ